MSNHLARTGCRALGALLLVTGALPGCSSDDASEGPRGVEPGVSQAALKGTGSGPIVPLCPAPASDLGTLLVPVDPSIVVLRSSGHGGILNQHFSMSAILQRLLDEAGSSETPATLLRRLWDPYNDPSRARFTEPFAPHCGKELNGYPFECPRIGDGNQADPATITLPSSFLPVAIFNRIDLARLDGSHCGEYRLIYWTNASNSGTVNFEAQMPNPHPECGVEACRPIADFWANLARLTSEDALGEQLRQFFYDGIPGFPPAIQLDHYGLGSNGGPYGASGGQIRMNTISTSPWQLREYHLALAEPSTKGGSPTLFFQNQTVKNNPFGDLFNLASTLPTAPGFQADFTSGGLASQVARLAAGDVSLISMEIADVYNAGQSTPSGQLAVDNYVQNLPPGADNAFTQAIEAAIPAGSGLTAEDIVNRATTQSCAGCHRLSNNKDLGGGLTWPTSGSSSFTHLDAVGNVSQALHCVFLPHRQSVFTGFLQGGPNPPEIIPGDCGSSLGAKSPTLPPTATSSGQQTLGGGSAIN